MPKSKYGYQWKTDGVPGHVKLQTEGEDNLVILTLSDLEDMAIAVMADLPITTYGSDQLL